MHDGKLIRRVVKKDIQITYYYECPSCSYEYDLRLRLEELQPHGALIECENCNTEFVLIEDSVAGLGHG